MGTGERGRDAGRRAASRRRFVRAVGTAAATAGVAGCANVTRYEFRADPVVMPVEARTSLGYPEERRSSVVVETSRTLGDVDVTATIESRLAVYAATGGGGPAPPSPVAVVSTPTAEVRGESLNPLVRRSRTALLTSAGAGMFRREAGLAVGDGPPTWARDPSVVASREATCIDAAATVEGRAGLLDTDSRPVAFVHMVRAEPASVVLAGAAHRRATGASGAFVGPDGALSQRSFDAVLDSFVGVVEALTYASP